MKLTPKKILKYKIGDAINQWLHRQGEQALKYVNFLDRCADIWEVITPILDEMLTEEGFAKEWAQKCKEWQPSEEGNDFYRFFRW